MYIYVYIHIYVCKIIYMYCPNTTCLPCRSSPKWLYGKWTTWAPLPVHCIKSHFMQVRFITYQFIFVIDCQKSIKFKIRFLGNTFVLITTFNNIVVKFIGGCSLATRSYVLIDSVSKISSFASVCGITIAIVT